MSTYADDLAARALELQQRAEQAATAALEAQIQRNRAVRGLYSSGWSYSRIARLLGISATRVGAIVTRG